MCVRGNIDQVLVDYSPNGHCMCLLNASSLGRAHFFYLSLSWPVRFWLPTEITAKNSISYLKTLWRHFHQVTYILGKKIAKRFFLSPVKNATFEANSADWCSSIDTTEWCHCNALSDDQQSIFPMSHYIKLPWGMQWWPILLTFTHIHKANRSFFQHKSVLFRHNKQQFIYGLCNNTRHINKQRLRDKR